MDVGTSDNESDTTDPSNNTYDDKRDTRNPYYNVSLIVIILILCDNHDYYTFCVETFG